MPEGSGINGFTMFLRTIPYNYYALLTLVMSLFLIFTGTDFGSMKLNEDNAKNGDLFTTADRPYGNDVDDGTDTCGHVADLLAPVLVLIVACIFGMIYTGGFFEAWTSLPPLRTATLLQVWCWAAALPCCSPLCSTACAM